MDANKTFVVLPARVCRHISSLLFTFLLTSGAVCGSSILRPTTLEPAQRATVSHNFETISLSSDDKPMSIVVQPLVIDSQPKGNDISSPAVANFHHDQSLVTPSNIQSAYSPENSLSLTDSGPYGTVGLGGWGDFSSLNSLSSADYFQLRPVPRYDTPSHSTFQSLPAATNIGTLLNYPKPHNSISTMSDEKEDYLLKAAKSPARTKMHDFGGISPYASFSDSSEMSTDFEILPHKIVDELPSHTSQQHTGYLRSWFNQFI